MDIFNHIQETLSDHIGYFTTPQDNEFGLAIFIRKTSRVKKVGETFVFRWKNARVESGG